MLNNAVQEIKEKIQAAIGDFATLPINASGRALFEVLGYKSQRDERVLKIASVDDFLHWLEGSELFSRLTDKDKTELGSSLSGMHFLFQITDTEIKDALGSAQGNFFDSANTVDGSKINSYLFFTAELKPQVPRTRTAIARIVRLINKPLHMPALILFRQGDTLTLGIINRRLHKTVGDRDVLEKVTLIKDISIQDPHRAHLEILYDLSIARLDGKYKLDGFVALQNAWRKTLDITELNRSFYKKLFTWYLYAVKSVTFPNPDKMPEEINNSINVIRLLTRLIFCWFIKEKDLIPDELFDERKIKEILAYADASKASLQGNQSVYYKAILQNLFFATLNTEMNRDNPGSRRFITDKKVNGVNPDYNNFTVYRHKDLFRNPGAALKLFENIPFLNGGLFECLDSVEPAEKKNREVRYDGFSSTAAKQPVVPDALFFGQIADVDLSAEFGGGSTGKHETVTGLIDILNSYKFTIMENTPLEEEVALDPELLGKVFENLLASYNPETRNTARNLTGSFYTPREIVAYMADESLKAYLTGQLAIVGAPLCGRPPLDDDTSKGDHTGSPLQEKLSTLFSHEDTANPFSPEETDSLIAALSNAHILDPACGSGAFPMGVLQRMVYLLGKLDPNNRKWKQAQLDIVEKDRQRALEMQDSSVREGALKSVEERRAYIEASFASSHHELDYLRKLFLIENCIYGVDIQNIAVQIAKLRFFISLIVDQKKDESKPNLGILAMPNLETKFVAADSLISIEKPEQLGFGADAVEKAEFELRQVRERIFYARKYKDKKELRKKEKLKRDALERALLDGNWKKSTAHQIAAWNPFDVSGSAPFFDPEMMFSMPDGFDIVIGNPPYMQIQSFSGQPQQKAWEAQDYSTYAKTGDVYCLFYEQGFNLLSQNGTLSYISSNQWMRTNYGKKLREFLAKATFPQSLIDFGDHQVFEAATVNTSILVLRKLKADAPRSPLQSVRIENDFKSDTNLADYLMKKAVPLADLSAESWIISSGPEYAVRKRIENVGEPLKEWDVAINRGILTGRDEAFIITGMKRDALIKEDAKSAEIIKPLLRGRDIKRYKTEYADLWLINSHNGYGNTPRINVKKDYPAIWEHLKTVNKETDGAVEKRQDQGAHWTNLRNCAYIPNFEEEKICWGNLAVSAQFALVKAGMYIKEPSPLITPASRYMLAVLNSTLGDYYIRSLGVTRSGGFLEYKLMFVENLPIPKIPSAAQRPYEILVDCILFAHEKGLASEASTLEWVINVMVYGLYFETEMKAADCYINDRVAEVVKPFKPEDTDEFKTEYVKKLNEFILKDNIIYHGLIHSRNVGPVEIIHGEKKK